MDKMRLSMRQYDGARDLAAMQTLLRSDPHPFDLYPTAADLPELLDPAVSDTSERTVVWEDPRGALAGFAIVSRYHNLHYHFHPDALGPGVEQEMVGWAVQRLQQMAGNTGPRVALDAAAYDEDIATVALLQRNGFTPTGDLTLRMARPLGDPLSDPRLPAGLTLRPLAGEGEVPAYVGVHRAAYGTENMTMERRLSIMRQPYYRPELDLVAVSTHGELAAFCVCAVDAEANARSGRNEGEIAIVGVHPVFRGRGLGRAMVLAGLRVLQQHGVDSAFLTVAGNNAPALRVYEAAGFRTERQMRWYTRPIEPSEL